MPDFAESVFIETATRPDLCSERAALQAVYDRQSEIDRYILRLCSVLYGPIGRNYLGTSRQKIIPISPPVYGKC
jgi:hypothetical protein